MDPVSILLLVLMVLAFWLLLIRPNQQRQKAARELQASLAVGDRIMLSSGIFGTVTGLGDEHVDVEVAPGTNIEVARGAVSVVVRDETDDADPDDEAERAQDIEQPDDPTGEK